jgi:hypothetical protein
VIKHEGKYYTTLSQGKRKDIPLRVTEKAGGQELMNPYIMRGF